MKIICAFMMGGFVLAGCTTDQAADSMKNRWVGKKADDFFATYGAASREQRLGDGRRVYSWRSSTIVFGTYVSCEADVVANPNGIISSIRPREDTVGAWNLSRCSEVFGS